jgi:acetyl-CoA decarbonylase/synthase complex subunit gamma
MRWIIGTVESAAGPVYRVSTVLTGADLWGHFLCRISGHRNDYKIPPGLYAAGNPGPRSDVFASANYKMSFDKLRAALDGMDAWVLVLDTGGINVWCAAGKGTFSTEELIGRLRSEKLSEVVSHKGKRIVVPQLGAAGVSAHVVARETGFKVGFGPVAARDIPAYVAAGYKADRRMKTVPFGILDRLVLTPMEIIPAMKWYPLFFIFVLAIFGINPSGVSISDALSFGAPYLLLGLVAVFSGAFVTPLLLPWIPFRSFAVKGWITGLAVVYIVTRFLWAGGRPSSELASFTMLFFPLVGSYLALQFTGSTTFTGMSGVKRELKTALPLYMIFAAVSVILLAGYKLRQWGVI